MQDELIRSFFKQGRDKGYSREHVRDILLNKGYDYHKVNYVYNSAVMNEKERDFSSRQEKSRVPIKSFLLGGALILLVVLGLLLLKNSPDGLTGMAVQDAEGRFSEIDQINQEIEQKKAELQKQIEQLKTENYTLEEKNQKIEELTVQLEQLHASIEEEHSKVRELLWDLLKTLLRRGEEQGAKYG